MSYLVLARKWRPTSFDEVVGQGHVTRTLKNAITAGRVAHAMLFTGSRGVGKTSCARILAKALNCDQGPTTTPCGVCPSCIEITEGRSVDVFEIDGASNNSVEQIREIREAVKFVSTRGKRKLYIIDEVHMLSTAAFNALLKTLEEPPPHVLFVFATTEPHKIPDTILSRCQRYDFKRIPERAIVEALTAITEAEGLAIEPAALHHIAREAQGGMRDSLSLLDQVIAFSGRPGARITEKATREVLGIADRRVLTDLVRALLSGDGAAALQGVDELFRFGIDLQKFAGELVQFLRDLVVIQVCADPARLVDAPPEEIEAAAELIRGVPPARLHRLFNALARGAEEVARSPFPKLLLEMTLVRLCEQGPTLPLADVLAGLARLESRLDHPVPPDPGGGPPGPPRGEGRPFRTENQATTPARPQSAPDSTGMRGPEASATPGVSGESRPEGSRAAWPGSDVPRAATPRPEAPRAEAPQATRADAPRAEAPQAPRAEAPRAEAPRAEAPRAEAPRAEAPRAGTPRAETPRAPEPLTAGNTALAPLPELPPHAGHYTRQAQGLLKHLTWPSETEKSAFDPPAAAVRTAPRGRPHLRVVPPLPAEPSVAEAPSRPGAPDTRADASRSDASRSDASRSIASRSIAGLQATPAPVRAEGDESLDLEDGRPPIEHYKALVDRVDGFTRSQLRNNTYVLRFDRDRLEVALPAVFAGDVEELGAALADAAARLLDRVPEVRLEPHPRGALALSGETVYEWELRRAQEARRAREDQARHDPAVQAAISILSAEIIDIKTD